MNSDPVLRKLTTIMAADVAGYSKLMATDEESTLRTFRTYRHIVDGLITKHGGRIFNTAGDAILAEFDSAVEGVRCTVSIQEELTTRNAELPENRRIQLRIGVNVGDVMIEGDDLFGDGVNVAARLEGLAQPGSICISASTFEQVKNKLSVGFEDLGPQEVKNIPYSVGAFQIRAGPVTVVRRGEEKRPAAGIILFGRRAAIVAGTMLILVLAGLLVWPRGDEEAPSLSTYPASFATNSMNADEIRRVMPGLIIEGIARESGRPFTIRILSDGITFLSAGVPENSAVSPFEENGSWWAEDQAFCMRFPRFGKGRNLCPRIAWNGTQFSATRRNGEPLDWTLTRQ